MRAVCRTESVADIIVGKISEFLGEFFAVLGLFAAAETGVLKKNDVAGLHGLDGLRGFLAGHVVISDKYDFLAELLRETRGDRSKGFALVRAIFDFAKVRAKDDLRAFADELFDGRKSRNDTGLVRDDAVLQRHVEIAADKHSLAVQIFEIINCFLLHVFLSSYSS